MRRGRTGLVLFAMPVAAVALVYAAAHDFVESAAFVVRAAGMKGFARTAAALEAERVVESEATIHWRSGQLRARTYTPEDVSGRPILLVPGVHAAGVDEPRLINFAKEIAAAGHPVTTAELPDLARYQITPRSTDMIEDAASWLDRQWRDRLAPADRKVGLMGISFAGGLSVVAASRLGDRAAWALSFGGHGDLPRTLRYLCTGRQPDGTTLPPHDYGVVIILLGVTDRVVPPDQIEILQGGIRTFLNASHLDMVDKPKGAIEFTRAREMASRMPEPARTYMNWVNDRNVTELGAALLPHVSAMGGDAALSPERNPAPSVPVYLLHGADDNVVPASESAVLAAHLRARGASVLQLATPLISHAAVDRPPGVAEIWKLIRFWAAPL
jgi:dienelactone hydrolase